MIQRTRKLDKDWVDAYFAYGVDVDNRRVWLTGEITEESIVNVIKGLYLMDSISKEPCELFISSPGGDVVEALSLYDILQTIRCDVHTFAFGKCQSAAPLLLAAGCKGHRWVAMNTEFMTHDYSTSLEGKGVEVKAEIDRCEKLNRSWLQILTGHTTMPYRHWNTLSNKKADYYFTAEQAIQWGLADHIWNERD